MTTYDYELLSEPPARIADRIRHDPVAAAALDDDTLSACGRPAGPSLHRADPRPGSLPPPGRARVRPVLRARPEARAGCGMTTIGGLIPAADRERLAARMRELAEIEALLREVPEQRPPGAPPALAELAVRNSAPELLTQNGDTP